LVEDAKKLLRLGNAHAGVVSNAFFDDREQM
jgi:hypothetical protein